MSITFSTALSPITGFAFACGHDNGVTDHRFETYDEARTFLQAEYDARGYTGALAVCGDVDYCAYGMMSVLAIESAPSPEMNVSNANAMHLLELLGLPSTPFEGSLAGSTTPEDFMGRVLLAEAINPADAGVPVTTTTSEGGATMVQMGRRVGYSEDRLAALRELADFAVDRGRDVQWC
ncbi:hypothetical protein [Arthrobacter sp. UYCo732]|uniref:hypothetical protein n=1 Tax=Arthrobacter sp. UYCo732 TaxID=3156336 RepID=UPI00339836DE